MADPPFKSDLAYNILFAERNGRTGSFEKRFFRRRIGNIEKIKGNSSKILI